jgi:ubiquinol-cytochrome c reductase cytochrome c1 subunit
MVRGVFGTDHGGVAAQFQVYEVCSTCHAVKHLAFRNLEKSATPNQVKGIGAISGDRRPQRRGPDVSASGPASISPGALPNDRAARAANNDTLPPDLSLITKAREGGPDYVAAVLTGFKDAPQGFKVLEGMYYNEYFPGHQIKMPPPLNADQVKYADNTPATVPQMAHDVVSFLAWAAEPNLEERHRVGFKVILFLVIATGVFYAAKRKIWSRIQQWFSESRRMG